MFCNIYKLDVSVLVELQNVEVEDGHVFCLKFILLSLQQVILTCAKLYDVLQTQLKLLAQQIVAGLCTFGAYLGSLKLALVGRGQYFSMVE